MTKNKQLSDLAEKVKELFRESLGDFRAADFVKVADLMGFHAVEKMESDSVLKPKAENYLPDIIGTNLQYVVEAYEWNTHVPMTEDGVIVSGFWDRGIEGEIPAGYEMEAGGRFLKKGRGLRKK